MLEAPVVCASVTELIAGATSRVSLTEGAGKSGARIERLVMGGQPYVLKHLDLAQDWTMRASGCLRGAPLLAWERGLLARLPDCFNQPIVGVCRVGGEGRAPSGGCAVLMRDVSPWLVPVTDEPISLDQHLRFLRHMAALHAAFWACGSECEVVPVMHRYLELSPWLAHAEAAVGSAHLVPRLVGEGWPRSPRPRPRSSSRWPKTRARWSRRWRAPRRRLCTATGSWTTWARTPTAGRSCWTGSSRGAARRCPTWPGTWRSTAGVCRRANRTRSPPTAARWRSTGSAPRPGGTASWRCACWARWSSSAGKRRSGVTTRSSRGGRRRRSGPHRSWAESRLRHRGPAVGRGTRAGVRQSGPRAPGPGGRRGGGRAGAGPGGGAGGGGARRAGRRSPVSGQRRLGPGHAAPL